MNLLSVSSMCCNLWISWVSCISIKGKMFTFLSLKGNMQNCFFFYPYLMIYSWIFCFFFYPYLMIYSWIFSSWLPWSVLLGFKEYIYLQAYLQKTDIIWYLNIYELVLDYCATLWIVIYEPLNCFVTLYGWEFGKVWVIMSRMPIMAIYVWAVCCNIK